MALMNVTTIEQPAPTLEAPTTAPVTMDTSGVDSRLNAVSG